MVFQQIEPLVSCSKTESMKGKVLIHPDRMISMEEGVMFADNKTIDFKGVNNAEVNI